METIKIGLREVSKDQFIQAVEQNNTLPDICRALGFNPTVVSTKDNIKHMIEYMELSHEHIKRWETNPELSDKKIKVFNIQSKFNKMYYEKFLTTFDERSAANYKSTIGNFMEEIGTNDFLKCSPDRIDKYANTKKTQSQRNNVTAHLRSLMIYLIKNDINGAISEDKVSKKMLVWLISK